MDELGKKKPKKKPKKPKHGPIGERLDEINEIAEELGYPGKLYPQEERFKEAKEKKKKKKEKEKTEEEKKDTEEAEEEMGAVREEDKLQRTGLWETIRRVIDDVFGEGTVDWEKISAGKKPKRKE